MEIAGYASAIIIGIVLGMMGGGGSILTVPVLVYMLAVNPLTATTYSLFIVGITSLTGGTRAYSKKNVDFKAVTEFGIPSIFSIFITRHYILPAIPTNITEFGDLLITRDNLLMIIFAVLMLVASTLMILNNDEEKDGETEITERNSRVFILALWGLITGFITGLLGAGGGFIIIPALVLFLKLRMKTAVGTSLIIIAINSLFGFLFSLKDAHLDWKLLLIFTALSIIGIYIGGQFVEKIDGKKLKKSFGWFVLVMGAYIIVKELFL